MNEFILKGKVPLYYRKNVFKSDRKSVLFIHGLSGSSGAWSLYEKELEKNYNVISLDLRGHGKSFKPKKYEDYCLDNFVEDIYDLIKHEKVRKFTIISHSFAALIALEFLRKYQRMVEKAVFISPTYQAPHGRLASFVKLVLIITKPLWPKIQDRCGWHVDYSNHKNTGDWNIPRLIQDVKSTGLAVYLTCSLQAYNFSVMDYLEKIKIPVLLIHGKKDTIFSYKDSVFMNKKIKGSKIFLINNSNHILVLNNFKEVSAHIKNFLKSN